MSRRDLVVLVLFDSGSKTEQSTLVENVTMVTTAGTMDENL